MEDIERLMMNETEHYDTAYEAGVENGISLGISQGINQGISQRNCEIARSMLEENIDITLISKITGLTYEQLSTLT